MKKDILKKLTKYTTASAAAALGVASANAGVIYETVDPDTSITAGPTTSFDLDIDKDGYMDFQFYAFQNGGSSQFGQVRIYGDLSFSSVGGPNNAIAQYSSAYGFLYPTTFSAGGAIDGNLSFNTSGNNYNNVAIGLISSSAQLGGYGIPVADSILIGFKFDIGGNDHYGWMRLSHSVSGPNVNTITLLDYAYNDCPLSAIMAGDTVSGGACDAIEDIEVTSKLEYTRIPLVQIDGNESEITLVNKGIGTDDAVVVTNIYKDPEYTIPFQTDTLTGISLDSASSTASNTTLTVTQFAPDSAGFYVFEHIVSSDSINDIIPSNDTLYYSLTVGKTFARDNNILNSNFGAHVFEGNGTVGMNYTLRNDGVIDSVITVLMGPEYHGHPLSASIYATDITGTPDTNNILFNTDTITYDTAVGLNYTYLPVHGGPVELSAGTYFIGVHQQDNIRVRVATTGSIYTPGANWYRETTGTEFGTTEFFNSDLLGSAWEEALLLRLHFSDCLPTYDSTSVVIEPGTSIVIDGEPVSTAGTYTETLKNVDGCDSIIVYNVGLTGVSEKHMVYTNIYPNPTNGIVNINSIKESINSIKVMDIQGKELAFYNNLNAKMNDIDMASFENGVYFVKIELANGTTEVAKIVKTDK